MQVRQGRNTRETETSHQNFPLRARPRWMVGRNQGAGAWRAWVVASSYEVRKVALELLAVALARRAVRAVRAEPGLGPL